MDSLWTAAGEGSEVAVEDYTLKSGDYARSAAVGWDGYAQAEG